MISGTIMSGSASSYGTPYIVPSNPQPASAPSDGSTSDSGGSTSGSGSGLTGYTRITPLPQSGGITGAGLMDIVKQLQAAQDKANKANESRYQDILGLYGNLGQAGLARIGQQETQAQAKGTQDLISRGLGNTTITSAISRGIASDAELARQQLQESVAMQKAGVMERRTDQGPDLGLYASLLQQAAQMR
jgi:hypothetical protein